MTTLKTVHGSIVRLNGGASIVIFDWFEEPEACIDCEVEPLPMNGCLVWSCSVCGGGSAELYGGDSQS